MTAVGLTSDEEVASRLPTLSDLDVAVDDALCVHVCQGLEQLLEDAPYLLVVGELVTRNELRPARRRETPHILKPRPATRCRKV